MKHGILVCLLVILSCQKVCQGSTVPVDRRQGVFAWLGQQSSALLGEITKIDEQLGALKPDDVGRAVLEASREKAVALFSKLHERMVQVGYNSSEVDAIAAANKEHAARRLKIGLARLKERKSGKNRDELLKKLAYEKRESWRLGDQFFVRAMLKKIRALPQYQNFFWHLWGAPLTQGEDADFHARKWRAIDGKQLSDSDCLQEVMAVYIRMYKREFDAIFAKKLASGSVLVLEESRRAGRSVDAATVQQEWQAAVAVLQANDEAAKQHALYPQWRVEYEKWQADAHQVASEFVADKLQTLWWRYLSLSARIVVLQITSKELGVGEGDGMFGALTARQVRSIGCGLLCRLIAHIVERPQGDLLYTGVNAAEKVLPRPDERTMVGVLAAELAAQENVRAGSIPLAINGAVEVVSVARWMLCLGGYDWYEWLSPGFIDAFKESSLRQDEGRDLYAAVIAAEQELHKQLWLQGGERGLAAVRVAIETAKKQLAHVQGKLSIEGRFSVLSSKFVSWESPKVALTAPTLENQVEKPVACWELTKQIVGTAWYEAEHTSRVGRALTRSGTKEKEKEEFFKIAGLQLLQEQVRTGYILFTHLLASKLQQLETTIATIIGRADDRQARLRAGVDPGALAAEAAAENASLFPDIAAPALRSDATNEDWRVYGASRRPTSSQVTKVRSAVGQISAQIAEVAKRVKDEVQSVAAVSDDLREGNAKEALDRVATGISAVASSLKKIDDVFKVGRTLVKDMHTVAKKALEDGYVRSSLGLEAIEKVAQLQMKEVVRKLETVKGVAERFSTKLDGTVLKALSKLGLKMVFNKKEVEAADPVQESERREIDLAVRTLKRIGEGDIDKGERERVLREVDASVEAA